MRIPCPFCGDRDSQEFVCRGDAGPVRPDSGRPDGVRPDGDEGFHDYVYLRDNVAGPIDEHWYHAQGCRTWIVVNRDTRTHEVFGSRLAQEATR